MTHDDPTTRVQWQYYRTYFSVPPDQRSLDAWGWDEPEGWWAAEDEEDAKDCAKTYGDGTYRSRVIHLTYDEWVEDSEL